MLGGVTTVPHCCCPAQPSPAPDLAPPNAEEDGGGLLGTLSDDEEDEELGLGQQRRQQPSTHERRLQKVRLAHQGISQTILKLQNLQEWLRHGGCTAPRMLFPSMQLELYWSSSSV